MSTTIKLNGTVINRYVLRDSLQIDEAVGERSTCSFTVITKGEIAVETGNTIEIYQDGELIFAGTVDTPEITKLSDGRFEIYVQCVDWHQICDRRIVSETYENRLAGDIVSDIVEKYLKEDGIHGVHVARTETTQADFATGTLSGVQATAAGDLELQGSTGNVAPNPSFQGGLTGWSVQFDSGNSVAQDTTLGYDDNQSAKMQNNVGGICWLFEASARTFSGGWQSATFRVKGTPGAKLQARFHNYSGGAGSVYGPTITLDGTWQLYTMSQNRESGSYKLIIELISAGSVSNIDVVQIGYIALFGTRTSPALDLSPAGIAASSSISWTATTPAGTGVTVETSLDGGATWQQATNGGAIPGITPGTNLAGKSLLMRQTLSTTDTTVTPKLHDLAVRINSSNIQDGPIVQEAVFSYVPATNVLDKLSDIAGFTWWIDASKQIHFCDRGTFTAPFPIDQNAKIMNVKVIKNRDNYRNRQYIRGGKGTTDPQTEIFKGNGAQKTFTVAFPIAKEPTVYVNDVQKTVGIKGVDSGKDWYWNKGDPVITQEESAPALQSADTLRVVYQGMFDIIALSTDFSAIFEIQSLEGGSGIYESVVEEPYITTIDAAFQTANALLKRYAKLGKNVRFETYDTGLHAGQIITINLPVIGAVGEFLIASVQYQSVKSFEHDYLFSVEAVSNFATNSWTKFFRENLGRPKTFVIRENVQEKETLIRLVPQAESISWADSQIHNIYQCFFPSDSIYPSDTLFTC